VKPVWRRKIRITDKKERLVQIPSEISIDTDYLYVTVEDGKIILWPPESKDSG